MDGLSKTRLVKTVSRGATFAAGEEVSFLLDGRRNEVPDELAGKKGEALNRLPTL